MKTASKISKTSETTKAKAKATFSPNSISPPVELAALVFTLEAAVIIATNNAVPMALAACLVVFKMAFSSAMLSCPMELTPT